jgi:hypothetical protein
MTYITQYLMVDIVTNHMAYAGCGDCVDYSQFNPFNKQSYYHPFCLIDYSNQTSVEQVSGLAIPSYSWLLKKLCSAGLETTLYLCPICGQRMPTCFPCGNAGSLNL